MRRVNAAKPEPREEFEYHPMGQFNDFWDQLPDRMKGTGSDFFMGSSIRTQAEMQERFLQATMAELKAPPPLLTQCYRSDPRSFGMSQVIYVKVKKVIGIKRWLEIKLYRRKMNAAAKRKFDETLANRVQIVAEWVKDFGRLPSQSCLVLNWRTMAYEVEALPKGWE